MIKDYYEYKILVLTGNGYRERALDWVEHMCNRFNILLFYSIKDANSWLKNKEE